MTEKQCLTMPMSALDAVGAKDVMSILVASTSIFYYFSCPLGGYGKEN